MGNFPSAICQLPSSAPQRSAEGNGWRVAGYSSRATSNPIRRTALGLFLCWLGVFVAPGARAQLIIERTVEVNQTIADRGQYVIS